MTRDLALHAEENALQYYSEDPLTATVYVTQVPCTTCTKQLIARRVRRVYYLYWMTGSETSIKLFEEMDITCSAFGKRMEVLRDFQISLHAIASHEEALTRTEPQKTVFSLLTQETERPSHRKP